MNGGLDNNVNALTTNNGNLYAGGYFTNTFGGLQVNGVAKWNGITWDSLGSGLDSYVYALNSVGNDIIAGGDFFKYVDGIDFHSYYMASMISRWDGKRWKPLVAPATCSTLVATAVNINSAT